MAIRFGSKEHLGLIRANRQQRIDEKLLFSVDKCLEEVVSFMKAAGKMEPVAEKISIEALRNCESREGMLSNRKIFKDYLAKDNPGHNPGIPFKDIQTGRTPGGSLISKVNNKVHIEIINPEDMEIMSKYLEILRVNEIPFTMENKEVHSPKYRKFVNAKVIEFQDRPELPPLRLN